MQTSWTNEPAPPSELDATTVFRRILVPIDFDEASRRALAMALELQRRFGSEVCLFRLTESSGNDEFLGGLGDVEAGGDLVERAEARLRRFVDNVFPGQSALVACRAHVGTDVPRAIDRAATQWQASLVILGCHPHHTIFRTQIEKVTQELDVPVMLLRCEAEAKAD
jgi:nucleotide-binding universal stress UspA family protein